MYSLDKDECSKIIEGSSFESKNFCAFVETGTYKGQTLDNIYHMFEELHSIELSSSLFLQNREKFSTYPKIKLYQGDSSKIFPTILPCINHRAIFFLDGHWSSGWSETSQGEKDCPLIEELQSINYLFLQEAIIIIDDYRLFGTNEFEDWSNITREEVERVIKKRILRSYVSNDRLIIEIKGM
jgi:hypothetical protein